MFLDLQQLDWTSKKFFGHPILFLVYEKMTLIPCDYFSGNFRSKAGGVFGAFSNVFGPLRAVFRAFWDCFRAIFGSFWAVFKLFCVVFTPLFRFFGVIVVARTFSSPSLSSSSPASPPSSSSAVVVEIAIGTRR